MRILFKNILKTFPLSPRHDALQVSRGRHTASHLLLVTPRVTISAQCTFGIAIRLLRLALFSPRVQTQTTRGLAGCGSWRGLASTFTSRGGLAATGVTRARRYRSRPATLSSKLEEGLFSEIVYVRFVLVVNGIPLIDVYIGLVEVAQDFLV